MIRNNEVGYRVFRLRAVSPDKGHGQELRAINFIISLDKTICKHRPE
jgi:hypothetical protein